MDIRHAEMQDLKALSDIEKASYPPEEGASRESIENRLGHFPDCFWILEDEGRILAFINGLSTDERDLEDVMYDNPHMHSPDGRWQMLFSVVTDPSHRGKGYASKVMRKTIQETRERGKAGLVLTCKDRLVGFYSGFGFVDEGLSVSNHGNVQWHQMRLTF